MTEDPDFKEYDEEGGIVEWWTSEVLATMLCHLLRSDTLVVLCPAGCLVLGPDEFQECTPDLLRQAADCLEESRDEIRKQYTGKVAHRFKRAH